MPDSLPVEFLFTAYLTTARGTAIPNGPQGTRYVVGVTGGTVTGPKINGKVVDNAGGDWVTSRADGSVKLDVRLTIVTDDGATILMTYTGIGVPGAEGLDIRSAPLFETGDERYAWLNRVQAVGLGKPGKADVTYQVYALSV